MLVLMCFGCGLDKGMLPAKLPFVKEFLLWAIPCIDNLYVPSSGKEEGVKKLLPNMKDRESLKEEWSKIKDNAYLAVRTGEAGPELLGFWYRAYPNVLVKLGAGSSSPMKDYMFSEHNEMISRVFAVDQSIAPCMAWVGEVKGVREGFADVVVLGRTIKCEVPDYTEAQVGDFFGVHCNILTEKLSPFDFEKYEKMTMIYGDMLGK